MGLFDRLWGYFRVVLINSSYLMELGDLKCTMNATTTASSCRSACLADSGLIPDVNRLLDLRHSNNSLYADVIADAKIRVQENKFIRDFIDNSLGYNKTGQPPLHLFRQCLLTSASYNFKFVSVE